MKKKILNIEGMTCSACSNGLEKYLNKQNGIKDASVNLVLAQAMVEYDENIIKDEDLSRFVKEAGFKTVNEKKANGYSKHSLKTIMLFSVLALFLMYISMGDMINLQLPQIMDKHINPVGYVTIEISVTALFLIWGFDILKNGIKNIIHRMPNMDSLVGIGVIVNFLYSLYNSIMVCQGKSEAIHNLYFESSAMIILFIKIGRKNKAKAVDTIKNLVTITPKYGTIIKDDKEIRVTINEINKEDTVISRPGEKIAVDGIITKGETHTDEAFLTGESRPVKKKIGDNVLAGSINYEGYIEYKAKNIGKDSSISHIVDLVVEATNTKAPITRLADKVSGYFVPFIFVIAILSAVLNYLISKNIAEAVLSLVSVLVVACPCSLGLATPLAMVVSIGKNSKNGVVIKSSECIEQINQIDTVAFDKTGTLTKGQLEIVDSKYNGNEYLLVLLQSLEAKSNHPLAKSIIKGAHEIKRVSDFKEIPGKGVKRNHRRRTILCRKPKAGRRCRNY